MKFSTYLTSTILLVFFGLMIVSITNYTVDPAGIYNKSEFSEKLVSKLASSKNGLIFRGAWNNRDVALALAKFSTETSCYVIGSSHVAYIGSARHQKSLTRNCPNLINLSVAGASLEDYIALSSAILNNKSQPKTIVFGIDPWSLNFNRDKRWIRYQDEYESLLQTISNTNNKYYKENSLVKNLINAEYFIHSINNIKSTEKTVTEAPDFDQTVGYKEAVRFPDGSFVHSKKIIQKRKNQVVTGLHRYKIVENIWYSESAVKTFNLLLKYLQKRYEVILVLAPYHPAIWKYGDQPIVTAMKVVEDKVYEIAEPLGIKVLGSYIPEKVGCVAGDFIDDMHASSECMMRLEK
jgi:hypothetical protein